ncbi:MAG TPA: T9SS type A sorting domain-containing protein [Lacibacter sp.]|nr:T9SS type A sorting domain-containing protein [Lacibacter sp.]HMO88486.1 T9SS type A sorting domain-containing protein [Lacibacter sp.]HMP87554.1 T9SS type A sorting domain-containing protein [Lacibacter sp.]
MKRILTAILCVLLPGAGLVATAQVPYNNSSYSQASATIFLDFDGQTVFSPYWNGGQRFICAAPALTNAQMVRIFNQVSEDFRPFNLNITTDSAVYFAAPLNRRMRVIITPTSSWYGSAGGVAYVESFRWGQEVPAFVFSALLNNNAKMISEAASHEIGHTLGLYHQSQYDGNCNFVTEYNAGQGSGEISWAPIMGNAYSRNLTLWHNGPNNWGCNNLQNDVAIIAGTANGFGFRPDDIGNTTGTGAPVTMQNNQFAINGFINTTEDVDFFTLNLPTSGRVQLNGVPFNVANGFSSANIDLRVSLLDQSGTLLATYNPSASVTALADTLLNGGTYYLQITNTSNINASNYGMIGSYALTGSFTANTTLPVYSLVLSGNNSRNKHELSWSIVADEPLESIVLEVSADGRSFTRLQELQGNLRKFVYQPFEKTTLYYRLHVTTASQLSYYSNIVHLREVKTDTKFTLVSNLITGNDILLNAAGSYTWRLVDMNGRSIGNGRTTTGINRIPAGGLGSGMYVLQVADGSELMTERLVKQ